MMIIPLVGMLGEVARILEGEDREWMRGTVREAGEAITRHHAAMAELMRERDTFAAAVDNRKLEILTSIPQGPAPGEVEAFKPKLRSQRRPRGVRIPPEALFGDAPISHSIDRREAEAAARAFYYDEIKGHPLLSDNPGWDQLSEQERDRRINA